MVIAPAGTVLDFYTHQGPMSDPREMGVLFEDLPRDLAALCEIVQGLLIHYEEGNMYGVELSKERRRWMRGWRSFPTAMGELMQAMHPAVFPMSIPQDDGGLAGWAAAAEADRRSVVLQEADRHGGRDTIPSGSRDSVPPAEASLGVPFVPSVEEARPVRLSGGAATSGRRAP